MTIGSAGAFVGVAEGVGVGELVGVGVGVGWTGVGFGAETFTPLFHTSFLPLLMQVYFLPFAVAVVPTFLQVSPVFTAALATPVTKVREIKNASNLTPILTKISQFEWCRYHQYLTMKS